MIRILNNNRIAFIRGENTQVRSMTEKEKRIFSIFNIDFLNQYLKSYEISDNNNAKIAVSFFDTHMFKQENIEFKIIDRFTYIVGGYNVKVNYTGHSIILDVEPIKNDKDEEKPKTTDEKQENNEVTTVEEQKAEEKPKKRKRGRPPKKKKA